MSSSQKRYLYGRQTSYNFGKALQFDGVDDYCLTNKTISHTDFTVSLWFNSIEYGNITLIGSTNIRFVKLMSDTLFQIRVSASSQTFIVPPVSLNQWHHFYMMRGSDGNVRVFVDGVESSTGGINDTSPLDYNVIGGFFIGANLFQTYKGKLDDVLITNTASLTPQTQATALYNGGLGADPLTVIPTAKQLYRFNGNGNNDGSLGGALTLNNFIADPYVNH